MIEARHLSWDSTFFGMRIAQLVGTRLEADDIPELDAWCWREQVDCLYFLADGPGPSARK